MVVAAWAPGISFEGMGEIYWVPGEACGRGFMPEQERGKRVSDAAEIRQLLPGPKLAESSRVEL